MFGGGGGMNPRKMKQMMNQMGIDLTELDAEEVIIRTPEEELVFHDADVQRMDAQGQQTYQVVGDPDSRPRGESDASAVTDESDASAVADESDAGDDAGDDASGSEFSEQDVEIVAQRAGVTEERARETLEETGDLAAAVQQLEGE